MVEVHLDLSDPASHRVGVSLRLKPRLARMRLQFPGWTPGSYLIRDYVRQLEALEVHQGDHRLEARRLSPACWQICPDPAGPELEIRYAVMAIELTVRTPHLDADHGFLPLAGVVLELRVTGGGGGGEEVAGTRGGQCVYLAKSESNELSNTRYVHR